MANIDPAPSWADIRQLETTDRNLAGLGGVLNTQPVSIAARLNLLRDNATALNNTVAGVSSRQDSADSAIASLESQVLDAPGTLSDLDHGAPISVTGDQFPDVLSIDNSRGPVLALNESIADLAQRDEYLLAGLNERSGTIIDSVNSDPLEIWIDPNQRVCFSLHKDGAAEFLNFKVKDLSISRPDNGDALFSGRVNVDGVFTQFKTDVSTAFPNALMMDVDRYGRVGRILYSDGREIFPGSGILPIDSVHMLPNGASGQNANGGFTCTGLTLITTGTWKNCWLVANDGRVAEDSTTYLCSILILSPDFSRIIREFTVYDKVTPAGSLQGVAWDESDDTIWFADQGANLVRHMDLNGALIAGTINTGFIPNAVARIPSEDALILPRYNTGTVDVYSCATGLLVRTISGIRADHDQAFYDSANNYIWYTSGANGADGVAYVASMINGAAVKQYTLSGSQAIEGIYVADGRITVVNDGAFHAAAKPPLAIACKYKFNY